MNEEKPKVVDTKGKSVNLQPGTYYYCRCGKSADGLWCDDSHAGTSFLPKKLKIDEPKSVYLCMCKATKNSPFCDGAHRALK